MVLQVVCPSFPICYGFAVLPVAIGNFADERIKEIYNLLTCRDVDMLYKLCNKSMTNHKMKFEIVGLAASDLMQLCYFLVNKLQLTC